MIRRWALPLIVGLILAIGTYYVTLSQTPSTIMAAAMKRLGKGGVNRFVHAPLAVAGSNAIVRPSSDLAYSSCVIDLTRGAVLVTVPAVPARYWSLSIFDARTDVAFVRNNRDTHGDNFQLVVTSPGIPAPPGVPSITLDEPHGVALIRILVDNRAAFPAIDRLRRQAECRPLDG